MIEIIANTIAGGIRALEPAGWVMVLAGILLLFGVVIGFLCGAAQELWTRFNKFLEALGPATESAGARSALALLGGARIAFELIAVAVLSVAARPCRAFVASVVLSRRRLRDGYLYTRDGYRTHASFAAFTAARRADEEAARAEDEDLKSFKGNGQSAAMPEDMLAFERALSILGLTADEARDMKKVKVRYRELMLICHPDKQFPQRYFAQLINEAMAILKKENGAA
ncbi:J domain-containing protein [Variovorax sp. H27-G14]|uniref:J domain-containing protein n=1 Tax=Variovorax sp. H27-G14 TaxID=3111914 RepID=UPI0038FD2F94